MNKKIKTMSKYIMSMGLILILSCSNKVENIANQDAAYLSNIQELKKKCYDLLERSDLQGVCRRNALLAIDSAEISPELRADCIKRDAFGDPYDSISMELFYAISDLYIEVGLNNYNSLGMNALSDFLDFSAMVYTERNFENVRRATPDYSMSRLNPNYVTARRSDRLFRDEKYSFGGTYKDHFSLIVDPFSIYYLKQEDIEACIDSLGLQRTEEYNIYPKGTMEKCYWPLLDSVLMRSRLSNTEDRLYKHQYYTEEHPFRYPPKH